MLAILNKCLILLAIFSICSELAAAEACGHSSVTIEGAKPTEEKAACASIEKLTSYFRSLGIEASAPTIHFYFKPRVLLPGTEISVHGYFNTDDNSIHMTHFDGQAERMPWGFVWNEQMASSFLLHEVAHLYAISYMGDDFRKLDRHWHEFLAYALQIELMESELKGRLLQFNGGAKAFEKPADVSSLHYEMDPDKYALRAYLSTQNWGSQAFLKNLLDRKIPESLKQ
jgi:hypothetical protein